MSFNQKGDWELNYVWSTIDSELSKEDSLSWVGQCKSDGIMVIQVEEEFRWVI